MRYQTKIGASSKNPVSLVAGVVVALGVVAMVIFGKPAFLDGILKTTPHDAAISQELLWEKAAPAVTQEIKDHYRNKYMTPLLDPAAPKTKDSNQRILNVNRSIDSLKIQSLQVSRRFRNDSSPDPELLVTATYTMDPSLDATTTRTYRAKAKNRGAGAWTFYGEAAQ